MLAPLGEVRASPVEADAQFSQQAREAVTVRARELAEQHGLGIDKACDGGIHPRATVGRESHQDAAPVVRVVLAAHEPALDEAVDAIRHRPARDERLLQQLLGAELERVAGAPQSREHVPLPRFQVAATERVLAGPVEVTRKPVDAREHFEGREVEVGTLRDPRPDDAVDLVGVVCHPSIIDRPGFGARTRVWQT